MTIANALFRLSAVAGMLLAPQANTQGEHARRTREAVARGYQAFFDKCTSGPGVLMPIDLEILAAAGTAKPKGQPTALRVAGRPPTDVRSPIFSKSMPARSSRQGRTRYPTSRLVHNRVRSCAGADSDIR